MRRLPIALLSLLLAVVIHVDWHLARPSHHRLSGNWPRHWLFAAAGFAVVGWLLARLDFPRPVSAGVWTVVLAVLLAQGIEPVAEVLLYQHRLGYPQDEGRAAVFLLALVVGIPFFFLSIALCRPRRRTPRVSAVV